MRILQITALYYPHVGGIENYVYQVSRLLVEKGHDVTVYTLNIPRTKKYEIIDNVKIQRFDPTFSLLNNHFSLQMLAKLIKKNDYDIIHAHGYLQFSTNYATISALKHKIPLIITSHGSPDYEGLSKYISTLYHKSLGFWTLSNASVVIALSPSQSEILHALGAKSITVVPNGINIQDIELDSDCNGFREKYELDNKTIILYVGSIIQRKGVEYLLGAMKNIGPNTVLIIVGGTLKGEEKYKEKLDRKIKQDNIHNVIFTGRIDEKMLKQAYSVADIFVLPSIAEGLPTVLLEAMAYKKAIIASNISGNNDLIKNKHNGILVEPKNSKKLADEINYLISNPTERKLLGINAYNTIKNEYIWTKICDQIERIYSKWL